MAKNQLKSPRIGRISPKKALRVHGKRAVLKSRDFSRIHAPAFEGDGVGRGRKRQKNQSMMQMDRCFIVASFYFENSFFAP